MLKKINVINGAKIAKIFFALLSFLCIVFNFLVSGLYGTRFSFKIDNLINLNYIILFSLIFTLIILILNIVLSRQRKDFYSVIILCLLASMRYLLNPLVENSYKRYLLPSHLFSPASLISVLFLYVLCAYIVYINVRTIKEDFKYDINFAFGGLLLITFLSIIIYRTSLERFQISSIINDCIKFSLLFLAVYLNDINKTHGLINSLILALFSIVNILDRIVRDKYLISTPNKNIETLEAIIVIASFSFIVLTYIYHTLSRFNIIKLKMSINKTSTKSFDNSKNICAAIILAFTFIGYMCIRANIDITIFTHFIWLYILFVISSIFILLLLFKNDQFSYISIVIVVILLLSILVSNNSYIFVIDGLYNLLFAYLFFIVINMFKDYKYSKYYYLGLVLMLIGEVLSILIIKDVYYKEVVFNFLLSISLVLILFDSYIKEKRSITIFVTLFFMYFAFQFFGLCSIRESELYYHFFNGKVNINSVILYRILILLLFSCVLIIEGIKSIKDKNKILISE